MDADFRPKIEIQRCSLSKFRRRSRESVRKQFWETVAPMHDRFVAPQTRWAHLVLESPPGPDRVRQLADLLRTLKHCGGDL